MSLETRRVFDTHLCPMKRVLWHESLSQESLTFHARAHLIGIVVRYVVLSSVDFEYLPKIHVTNARGITLPLFISLCLSHHSQSLNPSLSHFVSFSLDGLSCCLALSLSLTFCIEFVVTVSPRQSRWERCERIEQSPADQYHVVNGHQTDNYEGANAETTKRRSHSTESFNRSKTGILTDAELQKEYRQTHCDKHHNERYQEDALIE